MPDDPTLEHQIETLQRELDASRQTIDHLERRQRIDALLAASDPVDLEAARLLTEAAVAQMSEPDVAAAVDDLKRHKPFLFRPHPRPRPGNDTAVMSPAVDEEDDTTARAAAEAAATGDRRDLLRYLRLRRAT